jgi:hypothetical protein
MRAIIAAGDWTRLTGVDFNPAELNQDERNAAALLLAKGLGDLSSLPPGCFANPSATEVLDTLSRMAPVTEPRVIPYLIDALGPTDAKTVPPFDRRPVVYEILNRLTDRATGYSGGQIGAMKEAIPWWYKWWKANRDKHPIADEELRKKAFSRAVAVTHAIETDVKPRHWELSEFRGETPHTTGYSKIRCEQAYNPRIFDVWPDDWLRRGRSAREALPWMLIRIGFSTPDGPGEETSPIEHYHPPAELRSLVKTVYREEIPGSDVEISVLFASPDKDFVKDMESTLK